MERGRGEANAKLEIDCWDIGRLGNNFIRTTRGLEQTLYRSLAN